VADRAGTARRIEGDAIVVAERTGLACVNLRGDARDAKFARAVTGVIDLALPCEPNTSAAGLLATALWLGPDEWLITSETQSETALSTGLRKALEATRAAVTEVGHGRVVVSIGGSNARAVLAKGCSIDLHPRVFGPGRCAQTLLAKLSVLIHQRGAEPVYDVYIARSFADYAWAWLRTACAEFLRCDP
jgi:sarcosine oxidase subunit gamma